MSTVSSLKSASSQTFQAIGKFDLFLLRPLKVFSEFLSLLETYEISQSFSKIDSLLKSTNKITNICDGTFGTLALLKFPFNILPSVRESNFENATKDILGAVFNLKDTQNFFRTFNLTKYIPFSFIAKPLQWDISSNLILLAGTATGLWQIKDSYHAIQNWSETLDNITSDNLDDNSLRDLSHAFTIGEAVTGIAYSFFKILGNNSRLHSWAKFGLLASSTGFKIAASYIRPVHIEQQPAVKAPKVVAPPKPLSEIDVKIANFNKWIDKYKDDPEMNLGKAYIGVLIPLLKFYRVNVRKQNEEENNCYKIFQKANSPEWIELKQILNQVGINIRVMNSSNQLPNFENFANLNDPHARKILEEAARDHYSKQMNLAKFLAKLRS